MAEPTHAPTRQPEDPDAALRPKSLAEFVGQAGARDNLRVFIDAARQRGEGRQLRPLQPHERGLRTFRREASPADNIAVVPSGQLWAADIARQGFALPLRIGRTRASQDRRFPIRPTHADHRAVTLDDKRRFITVALLDPRNELPPQAVVALQQHILHPLPALARTVLAPAAATEVRAIILRDGTPDIMAVRSLERPWSLPRAAVAGPHRVSEMGIPIRGLLAILPGIPGSAINKKLIAKDQKVRVPRVALPNRETMGLLPALRIGTCQDDDG